MLGKVHGVAKSWTQLSDWTTTYQAKVHSVLFFNKYTFKIPLEEEMTTDSRILAWRILWTEEPGGRQFMGSHRAGSDWSGWAHAHALLVCSSKAKAIFLCYLVVPVIIFSQQIIIPDRILESESRNHHSFNDDFSIHGNIFFPGNIFKEHILS